MTKNEAYRELKRYRQELFNVANSRRRLAEIELELTAIKGTDYAAIRVSGGSQGGELDGLIDKIYAVKTTLANSILRSESARKVIVKKIEQVEFPYGEILHRRYIDFQNFEEISYKMSVAYNRNYSYDGVRQTLARGVGKYCEIK